MGQKVSRVAAVAALITCPTIKEAASQCSVSEKTMHKWLNDPAFATELRQSQDQVTREAMGQLLGTMRRAIRLLQEVMDDPKAATGAKVSAARAVLDHGVKVYELETVQRRLEALEAKLYGQV